MAKILRQSVIYIYDSILNNWNSATLDMRRNKEKDFPDHNRLVRTGDPENFRLSTGPNPKIKHWPIKSSSDLRNENSQCCGTNWP